MAPRESCIQSGPYPTCATPATVFRNPAASREPLPAIPTGSSASSCTVRVVPMLTVVVSTVGGAPVTVTVWLTCPTARMKSALKLCPEITGTFVRSAFWNPCMVTVTVYTPMGRSVKEKPPTWPVTISCVRCVPSFTTVTLAPATTAPELSRTVPVMPPTFVCWAHRSSGLSRLKSKVFQITRIA